MSNQDRWFTPAKNVLLTGAGFTKNFGGYLAREMWELLLNRPEIRQSKRLHAFLRNELDYETAYDKVTTSDDYTEEEKSAFTTAIRNAYQQMHKDICQEDNNVRSFGVCSYFVAEFQRRLQEQVQKKGFLFTLNQDLFVEKYYLTHSSANRGVIKIPGLEHSQWFNGRLTDELEEKDGVTLPDDDEVAKIKGTFWDKSVENFAYIKLHGSLGWIGKDGLERMVIGNEKTVAITQEPLLQWYFSLFKEVLTCQPCNLVVIGYGFRDWHINLVIGHAIEEYGLRLHVVSPKKPKEFQDMLCQGEVRWGKELWAGLIGYHTGVVTDFLKRDSQDLSSRGRAFFDSLEA